MASRAMRAVVVGEDRVPVLGGIEAPQPGNGLAVVDILAAALTNLDIGIAEGRHYLSPTAFPAVVGREAVARTADGRRVYLNVDAIAAPYGSMADKALADLDHALPVPDGLEDALAAALGNAGMAAWLSLSWRARMQPGETVLILGATGACGLIAVAAAKALGAGRIVAAGRNPVALEQARAIGADRTISLDGGDFVEAFRAAAGGPVDVVIDMLNGPPAEAALRVMGQGGRMVQMGQALGSAILLDAQIARRRSLDVLGFGYYHAPIDAQRAAYGAVAGLVMAGKAVIAIESHPLEDFATALARHKGKCGRRIVLLP